MRLSHRQVGLRLRVALLVSAAAVSVSVLPAASQDVEMLGARHGARPPQALYDALARDPLAFQFSRGRTARMRARMGAGISGAAVIGRPQAGPVVGDFAIPVVLGLFSDSPGSLSVTEEEIAEAYFGSGPGTISRYFKEVSGGRVTLTGPTQGWVRSTVTQLQATGGTSGLSPGLTGTFIVQLLGELEGVDWAPFDNDGPDGVPNSGDDDGFVDVLAVLQPTAGAECGGPDQVDRIWSHRWSLEASAGGAHTTSTAAAGGGFILIDDYVVEPVFACNEVEISEIGVFTHELGHAFGLPDLYDTHDVDGKHAGIGSWGLMGAGAWGCDGDSPSSPCHLSAWSKEVLGWADVRVLEPDVDHGTLTLPPVETSGTVYRIDAAGASEDYFLLENRQRVGFDGQLRGEGLLIWHIDPEVVRQNWGWNGVNAFRHRGVWLRQADGLDELGMSGGGRGDRDDAYPMHTATRGSNTAFHAGSNPAAISHVGTATGLTVMNIEQAGEDISMDLLTTFVDVTVRTVGDEGAGGLLTVDGLSIASPSYDFAAAPFESRAVEAAAGAPLGEGRRRAFHAWEDDPSAPRLRQIVAPLMDAEFVARYQGLQVEMKIETAGGVNGVAPGSFASVPTSEDLWFEEGAEVMVQAVPQTGFAFLQWTGDLDGQPNPASVTLTEPVVAGADFALTYEVPTTTITFPAATTQHLQLEVENGTAPVFWSVQDGVLPPGIALDPLGNILGSALDFGAYPVTVEARDALGLTGRGTVTFQVDAPDIGIGALASDFLTVGPGLNADQRKFLDRQGNRDSTYDLGDFRSWVLAHPELPLSAALRVILDVPPREVAPLAPMAPGGEGGR